MTECQPHIVIVCQPRIIAVCVLPYVTEAVLHSVTRGVPHTLPYPVLMHRGSSTPGQPGANEPNATRGRRRLKSGS